MFDALAEEHSRALFFKIDINSARDAAAQFRISATPTFITFFRGVQEDQWSGADPSLLKTNVERLIHRAFPPHPHSQVKIPSLQVGSMKPFTYSKVPPLDKLVGKLGPAAHQKHFAALHSFVAKRNQQDAKEALLPDLQDLSRSYADEVTALPLETRFAAVDLLRLAMIDPRVSGFFAEEDGPSTILALIHHANSLEEKCPHNLRLVTLHLACNIFTSPLYSKELLAAENKKHDLVVQMVQFIASSLIDVSHPTARVASASLAFNLAAANYRIRREQAREGLEEAEQVALAASLLEVLPTEENEDALKTMLLALGFLAFFSSQDGELHDLCQALDAKATLGICKAQQALAKDIGVLFS
jgi:hypothetical protein